MTPSDCAAALCVLKNHAIRAALEARDPADMLQAQRDIVEGARRLLIACERTGDTGLIAEVRGFHEDATRALARYEASRQLPPVQPRALPAPPQLGRVQIGVSWRRRRGTD